MKKSVLFLCLCSFALFGCGPFTLIKNGGTALVLPSENSKIIETSIKAFSGWLALEDKKDTCTESLETCTGDLDFFKARNTALEDQVVKLKKQVEECGGGDDDDGLSNKADHWRGHGERKGVALIECMNGPRLDSCSLNGKNVPRHDGLNDGKPMFWDLQSRDTGVMICKSGNKEYRFKISSEIVYGPCH